MNRRNFLKSILYTAAAASVPVSASVLGYSQPERAAGGNNFDSHFTRKLMQSFLDKFEENRLLNISKLESL